MRRRRLHSFPRYDRRGISPELETDWLFHQSDEGAKEQDIYGFSHFTLPKGDYSDINLCKVVRLSSSVLCADSDGTAFEFRMVAGSNQQETLMRAPPVKVEVDPIPELSN